MTVLPDLTRSARAHWRTLGSREKSLIQLAIAVLAVAVLWWVAISPALKVWHQAEPRRHSLDARWQHVQRLAAETQALRTQPVVQREEALRALDASVRQYLGTGAQLTITGDRATLALKNVSAGALAQWLPLARVNARAVPIEARLKQAEGGSNWNGTLVLSLPPQ